MRHTKRFPKRVMLALSGLMWLACTEGPAAVDQLLTLRISPRDVLLASIGDTVFLSAELNRAGVPVELSGAAWGIIDEGIVDIRPTASSLVRARGFVVAKEPGVARVWINASGRSDTIAIEVRQMATLFRIGRDGAAGAGGPAVAAYADTLESVDDTLRLTVVARDRRGNVIKNANLNVKWRSSDTTIASVTDGLIRARRRGQAVIIASYQSLADSATIVVGQSVSGVSIAGSNYVQNAIGDSTRLTMNAQDGSGQTIPNVKAAWTSRSPTIATVDEQGVVVGRQPGYAMIVGTYMGFSDSTSIQVRQIPATVSVLPNTLTLAVNATYTFNATVSDSNGVLLPGAALVWSSANTTVATMSGATVTARAAGNTTITANHNGVTGSAALTVNTVAPPPPPPPPPPPAPVASVTVSPATASIQIGASTQLTATTRDAANNILTGRVVTWSTSSALIATVSATGLVQGVGAGTATITATSETRTGTASVTVTSTGGSTLPPGNPGTPVVTISNATVDSFTVTGRWARATNATRYDWSTGSNDGAWQRAGTGPDSSAVFRAPSMAGGYWLCVTAYNSAGTASTQSACATYTAPASGPAPVATVTVTPSPASVQVGATVALTATLRDASNNVLTGRSIIWSSSATGIATVNASGVVTGVAAGTATITATSEGRTGTSTVTVTASPPAPVATVTLSPASPSVQAGSTVQLTATLRDASNNVLTGRTITWSSGNTAVATVNATGLVAGVIAGSATITATSEGRTGTATVTVTAPPPPAAVATVTVSPSSSSMQVGGTGQLTATLRDASNNILTGRTVTWSSSNTGVATVSASGLVSGVAVGSATITATSETRTGTSSVTVTAPPPPPTGSAVFRSDWSTATGSSISAVTDGGRFDNTICSHPDVLAVVSGAALGWTATPNVLQATNRGESRCWEVETTNSVPQNTNFYIRFYVRVEDEDQSNFHPTALNVLGDIQMSPWSLANPTSTGYLPSMRLIKQSYSNMYWVRRPELPRRIWYRFEYFVEIVSTTARTFRVWPRIYDMGGNMIADASNFTHIDGGSRTLKQFYDSGGTSTYTSADMLRRFGLGYEGTGGANNTGKKWYYAGVEIRTDTWPGPIQ